MVDKVVKERSSPFIFSAAEIKKFQEATALPREPSTAEIIQKMINRKNKVEAQEDALIDEAIENRKSENSKERFNELRAIMMMQGPYYRELISDEVKAILTDYNVEIPKTSSFAHERREYDDLMLGQYKEGQRYKRALVFKEEFAKALTPLQLINKRKSIGLGKEKKEPQERYQEAMLRLDEPLSNLIHDARRDTSLDELYEDKDPAERLKLNPTQSQQSLTDHNIMTVSKYGQEIL